MSVDCSDLRDFPCGSWVKLTTRLGQDIEGEVLSHDEAERALLLKQKVDMGDIETRACNIHLVNLDHVSKVSVSDTIDKGALRSAEAFLQSKLNTSKLEKRRIRHLEEKQNAAYALKQDIDPVGVQLFNMIKKQLPDGLRWNGKDIEIHGVKITPDYAEKNCVLANDNPNNTHSLQHIKKLVRRFHEKRV